jgi:hypothetical protein
LSLDNALRSGDFVGCAKYLDGVSSNADVAPLWRQLAEKALSNDDIQVKFIFDKFIYRTINQIRRYFKI